MIMNYRAYATEQSRHYSLVQLPYHMMDNNFISYGMDASNNTMFGGQFMQQADFQLSQYMGYNQIGATQKEYVPSLMSLGDNAINHNNPPTKEHKNMKSLIGHTNVRIEKNNKKKNAIAIGLMCSEMTSTNKVNRSNKSVKGTSNQCNTSVTARSSVVTTTSVGVSEYSMEKAKKHLKEKPKESLTFHKTIDKDCKTEKEHTVEERTDKKLNNESDKRIVKEPSNWKEYKALYGDITKLDHTPHPNCKL